MLDMKDKSRNAENAHKRLDVLEPIVSLHHKWIIKRQKSTDQIKYILIGGTLFYVLDTIGLLEFIKLVS